VCSVAESERCARVHRRAAGGGRKGGGGAGGAPVMRVLVMWLCTPERPCQPGPAPAPPAMVS